MKKIITACIKQLVELDSQREMYLYLGNLQKRKIAYRVLDRMETPEGKIRLIICKAYNGSPLMEE